MYLLLSRNFGNFGNIDGSPQRKSLEMLPSPATRKPQLDPYRDEEVDTSTIAQAGQLKTEDRDSKDENDPPSTR